MATDAALCVYGMAEATLGITMPKVGAGMQVESVNRLRLVRDGIIERTRAARDSLQLVRLGQPIDGIELRITSGAQDVGEGVLGSIEIRGQSISPGYVNGQSRTQDQWFETGDLGYLTGGQLVVCGRSKGLVVVGGTNYFAEDIERILGQVPGVRAGNAFAFSATVDAGEHLVIAVESRMSGADIAGRVRRELLREFGLRAREVVVLEPGRLAKTSSGKIARSECVRLYEMGELK